MSQLVIGRKLTLLFSDQKTKDLYIYLLQKASVPYWDMLKSWIYKGLIRDPYKEFLIQDNADVERETHNGLSQTYATFICLLDRC